MIVLAIISFVQSFSLCSKKVLVKSSVCFLYVCRESWRIFRETSWSSLKLQMLRKRAWPWRNTTRSEGHLSFSFLHIISGWITITAKVLNKDQVGKNRSTSVIVPFNARRNNRCSCSLVFWPFLICLSSSGMWERQRGHPPVCGQRKGVWRNRFR